MDIQSININLPEFNLSEEAPIIPSKIFINRCRSAYTRAGCDWLVVYGDREHFANLAYLTGFDPRFEEALLLVGPDGQRILVVGNEGVGYASFAGLPLDVILCQSFSLMGQDRSIAPRLSDVFTNAGIRRGQRIALIGWKYFEENEWIGKYRSFYIPAFIVDILKEIAGDLDAVLDATEVLMHPTQGLRSFNEVEQIASFEWSASRASAAVLKILNYTRPGMTEFQAASSMGYGGDPFTAHFMFASGKGEIIGLRSPTGRYIELGDGITIAIGFRGDYVAGLV